MGLRDKIKDALHGDDRDETTTHGHNAGTTGTTTGNPSSAPGAYPTDESRLHKTDPRTQNHGLSSHDPNYSHQTTDSGVGLDDRHRRDHTSTTTNTTTTTGQNDPYWGAVGRDDPTRVGHNTSSSLNRKELPLRPGEEGTGAYGSTGYGNTSTNAGPHDSNLANKVDPRVDSDRDNRGNYGTSGLGTTGHGTTGHDISGHNTAGHGRDITGHNTTSHGTTGLGAAGLGTAGHSTTGHNTIGRDTVGHNTAGHGTAGLGSTTNTGYGGTSNTGYGSTSNTGYGNTSTNAGPHNSNVANKLDPRVDSDRDGRGHGSHQPLGGGQAVGGGTYSTEPGSHQVTGHRLDDDGYDSRVRDRDFGRDSRDRTTGSSAGVVRGVGAAGAGIAASEVARHHRDRDLDQTASSDNYQRGGGVPQTSMLDPYNSNAAQGGIGHNTRAGPHDSNIGNKLDPRVDSDLDSRRGNQLGTGGPGGLHGGQYDAGHSGHGVGGAGAGAGLTGAGLSGAGLAGAGAGPGTGGASTGLGSDHYGPAHEGAKVFHKCRGCGMDNDISQYFRKDAVYRMG